MECEEKPGEQEWCHLCGHRLRLACWYWNWSRDVGDTDTGTNRVSFYRITQIFVGWGANEVQ